MHTKEYSHYLNVGCGNKYDKRWTNIDFVGNDEVQTHNLLHGLPYADDSFSLVYLSQVIEHFSQEQALALLKECHRVMKKDGVIRLATPDLEETTRRYLESLEQYKVEALPENKAVHDWYVIELIDQSVRNRTEGEMGRVLRQPNNVHHDFLLKRVGHIAQVLQQTGPQAQTSQPLAVKRHIKNTLKALQQWRTLF